MARWRKRLEAPLVPPWVLDAWVNGGDPDGVVDGWLGDLDPDHWWEAFVTLTSTPTYTQPR
jgi:hypothetical protein